MRATAAWISSFGSTAAADRRGQVGAGISIELYDGGRSVRTPRGSTSSAQRTRVLAGLAASASRHCGRNACSAARRALCTSTWPRSKPARRAIVGGTGGNTSTTASRLAQRSRALDGVVEKAIDVRTRMRLGNEQRHVRRRRQLRGVALAAGARRRSGRSRASPARGRPDGPGKSVCTITVTGELGAAGAAGDLHQQRGEPLGGAEIGAVERVVGAEHAHQRQPRKIVALGEHLRADEDVELAVLDALAHVGERILGCASCRGRRARPARAGKSARIVCSSRCVPKPSGSRSTLPHSGHARGGALDVPAMVAAQPLGLPMHDEARRAARTFAIPTRTPRI